MIIVRAPFRIPIGGGGTDLPSYYSKYGGDFISAAINKYMFISVNRQALDKLIHIKYSLSEEVEKLSQIQHELAREALILTGIKNQIDIHSMADIPAGTGMGSSGSYLVGLLKALHTLKNEAVGAAKTAEEACWIEINKLGKPVGKQDQYIAAYGGITHFIISKKGRVKAERLNISHSLLRDLENSIIIFYTGIKRSANDILQHQNRSIVRNDSEVTNNMHMIKEIGQKIGEAIKRGDVVKFGRLLDEHWQTKKKLSSAISFPEVHKWYKIALENGALGGKLMGAGGGGFLMFCCPGDKTKLRHTLAQAGLEEMLFHFDMEGTKVIADL